MIPSLIICSKYETGRERYLVELKKIFPNLQEVEAIFPAYQKVPFLEKLLQRSKERTGTALNKGELGVLLSNRKIWRWIVANSVDDLQSFLVLESDSMVLHPEALNELFPKTAQQYDLFFWGAWSGHMQLLRSKKSTPYAGFQMGEPYIKTVYGAYGYSLNRKAAAYLLRQTAKVAYPVDQYKRFLDPGHIRIGGIVPEIITHDNTPSTIGHPGMHPLLKKAWISLLDAKNAFICALK